VAAPRAGANPVLGFLESFTSTTTSWGSQSLVSNPGTGGVLGASDGYMLIETPVLGNWGAASGGTEYTGNWHTPGITQVKVWLNDVGTDDLLEVHFSIGNTHNFWQYNVGFLPPLHSWGQFTVDLTAAASFTQIIVNPPGGTFATALDTVERIHFRHDKAPYVQAPNTIVADGGIDEILLTNPNVLVEPPGPIARQPVDLSPPYPNPSRGPVTIALVSTEPGPVTVQIVDVSGRELRRVELPGAAAGPRTYLWDGLDARGLRVPAGVYRVRAFGAPGGMSRPLVRVD
jgi:hypothetical protein